MKSNHKLIKTVIGCEKNERCEATCSLKKKNCKHPQVSYSYEIRVPLPVWSESSNSWHVLVNANDTETAWSGGHWFPKKCCTLTPSEDRPKQIGVLTVPKWLYKKKFPEEI